MNEPTNRSAEEAVIGSCLLSDVAIDEAAEILTADDFHSAAHQHIFAAILAHRHHGRADVITISAALAADGWQGEPYDIGSLHRFTITTPAISMVSRHAHLVADTKLRRRLCWAAAEIDNLARGEGFSGDAGEAADKARDLLAGLDLPTGHEPPARDVDSFIGTTDMSYDWLIPDMLERRDRVLVTAGEGAGKSVLLAQIAVQCAAGIHPWTWDKVAPRNVLVVDCENGERLMSRRYSPLRAKAGKDLDPQRLRIECRPDGIDLTTRTDRRWLADKVRSSAAELLVIGPVYRLSTGVAAQGDIGGEDQVRKITKALDEIRIRQNVTLLMETHAPHGNNYGRDLRPFGSSVWLRWPEFGIGLRRESDDEDGNTYKVEHWRGQRDFRHWPITLQKGGSWPWTPTMAIGAKQNRHSLSLVNPA